MHDISRIFFDHPHPYPYFYQGADSDVEQELATQLEIVSEIFLDFMSLTLTNEALAPDDEHKGWIIYFSYVRSTSPYLRDHRRSHSAWYENALHKIMDQEIFDPRDPSNRDLGMPPISRP